MLSAKINVKVLIVLILVTAALGASLFAARHIRRRILSKMSLNAGQAAFENKDWPAAYEHFQEYLGRNPDNIEILKKYAKASLSIRPLDGKHVGGAIAAYRRVLQKAPLDELAYDKLAMLYPGTGNFEELAYIARKRIANAPNDRKAPLRLSEALIQLNKRQEAQETLDNVIAELVEELPDKRTEYVQACVLMSRIEGSKDSLMAKTKALELLNRAINDAPESVEALVSRSRFYRQTTDIPGKSEEERLRLARKDLESADELGTKEPLLLYSLGAEWIVHGELDRADAELRAAESVPQETLEKHFFDLDDWAVIRFRLASELMIRRAATTESAALADEMLSALTQRRHRIQILPFAIRLYYTAGKALEARR